MRRRQVGPAIVVEIEGANASRALRHVQGRGLVDAAESVAVEHGGPVGVEHGEIDALRVGHHIEHDAVNRLAFDERKG